jgi:hypothetical protein
MKMDDARARFSRWFADVLRILPSIQGAGFASVIVSIALLERYLRELSGVHEKSSLDDRFYEALAGAFPSLKTNKAARRFWKIYRHGLLHQVAFSTAESDGGQKSFGGLRDDCEAVELTPEGHFWVNPAKFAAAVVKLIEADFATFLGSHSPNHQLPVVGLESTLVLGTASPEAWKLDAFRKIKGRH